MAEANECLEIEPGAVHDYLPPICLPDEFDRVVSVFGISKEETLEQMRGMRVAQTPTKLYRFDDVLIADRSVMTRAAVSSIAPDRRRMVVSGPSEDIDEALLCSNYFTELFFGHWVYDGWQREMLARDRGLRPIWLERQPWWHEPGYRKILGFDRQTVTQARIGRLWIADDGGLNSMRMQRIDRLRQRIRRSGTERVFLTRGTTGVGRKLVNEDDVIAALSSRGFTTFNPEKEQPQAIVEVLRDARIVVTVEGSAGVHPIMSAPDDAGFIFIQPASRFNVIHQKHCGVYGHRFGYTVADDTGDGDIRQPVDRLLKTLDLMEKAIGS